MLRRFLKKRAVVTEPSGSIPDGQRVYAIGDIHGCDSLLEDLISQIQSDDAARRPAQTTLIFLGDLVDRGPDSSGVVRRLMALESSRPAGSTRFLLGNHEEVFLLALAGDPRALRLFDRIGGRETILSYGVSQSAYDAADFDTLLELTLAHVPESHRAFLERFEDLIVIGDYAFVHAGVDPSQPLGEQKRSDLRWIREGFLDYEGDLQKIVVHGHTITEEVEQRAHRIGLDTGAYASSKLTAMGFEGSQRWVLQAKPA